MHVALAPPMKAWSPRPAGVGSSATLPKVLSGASIVVREGFAAKLQRNRSSVFALRDAQLVDEGLTDGQFGIGEQLGWASWP
jgi:hypothetical protein